ncbi:hypothetical protein K440DRAFT_2760 [Wilcoxina mikolae CBS 423.85]|nr:hypothetical protein K440DRAFT_2760 [Wilcoxina mikolae CBS 423.85]
MFSAAYAALLYSSTIIGGICFVIVHRGFRRPICPSSAMPFAQKLRVTIHDRNMENTGLLTGQSSRTTLLLSLVVIVPSIGFSSEYGLHGLTILLVIYWWHENSGWWFKPVIYSVYGRKACNWPRPYTRYNYTMRVDT